MRLVDDPAFSRVAEHLERLGASAFSLYKAPCLERRLASRIRARRRTGLADYASLLDADADERERLLSSLAIGVTSFFRNPTAWTRLAELLAEWPRGVAGIRGWSAGCATGEEAYSLAMLLASLAERAPTGARTWRVDATDLDRKNLSIARQGAYPLRVVSEIRRAGMPDLGTSDLDRFVVTPEIRERIRFRKDDLTETRAVGPYDVVICRNVLIYFGDEGQARTLAGIVRVLAPGGLLLLGRAELAARQVAPELEIVDPRERIYRRRI